jgi:hypothetical protein
VKVVRLGSLPALVLAAAVIPACGHNPKVPEMSVSHGETVLKASLLSGRQQVPPVSTAATGTATVTLNAALTEATVVVTVDGLADITMAHIHAGNLGVNGPILFTLAEGSFGSPLVLTLSSGNLTARPEAGIQTFAEAVNAMRQGLTYVNVHSVAHPDGEIRGQLGPATLAASLDGAHETPPTGSGATGALSLTLNEDQTQLMFILSVTGMENITAAHIHVAPPGVPGPIVFPLSAESFTSPLTGTLTSLNFTPQPGAGVSTLEEAVDAILSGNSFVNVHSVLHPSGEIRGQIVPLAALPAPPSVPATTTSTTTTTTSTTTTPTGTTTTSTTAPTSPGSGIIGIPLYSSRPNSRNQ